MQDEKFKGKLNRSDFEVVVDHQERMYFRTRSYGGERLFHIMAIARDEVTVVGSYFLAGYSLDFQVDITPVQKVPQEERGQPSRQQIRLDFLFHLCILTRRYIRRQAAGYDPSHRRTLQRQETTPPERTPPALQAVPPESSRAEVP